MAAEPRKKPANVPSGTKGTAKCTWCCPNNHRGLGGITLTCSACGNTGHKATCVTRTGQRSQRDV